MSIPNTRSAARRSIKFALMISAAAMATPITIDLISTPAYANRGGEINWRGSNRPARRTYYRSEVTGSVIPLYYTDPPYDASDSSMRLVGGKVIRSRDPNVNKQYQVLDEINFDAQQQSDAWGTIKELNGLESSLLNRGTIEFGAVVTQSGYIAKEQRKYMFDALVNRMKAQARMVAIGNVMEKMRANKVLTRDGLRFYQDMISDQQSEINIAEDTLSRLDKTQAEAFAIDLLSLGTARLGTYAGQAITKAQTARQLANQVATKQAAVQTARQVEQRAAVNAAETALVQAERQAAATAVKVKTAQEGAKAASATTRSAGTRAVQTEAAVAAKQAEAAAAQKALTGAHQQVGRSRVVAAGAKAGAESAEAALSTAQREALAADRALTAAKAKAAAAVGEQQIAAARNAVQRAQTRAATSKAAVETARQEARAATTRAATASADAAAARAQLAKAKAADSAARTAAETAKAEAQASAAALSRAQTASNAASDKLARAATQHSDELANVASKLAQQQLVTNQAVQSAAANYAQANTRLATAHGQLAAAGSNSARANAAALSAAAQKELEQATKALVETQVRLANLEQRLATVQQAKTFTKWFEITKTSLGNRFFGALADLTAAIVTNQAGPHLAEFEKKVGEFIRSLTDEEREKLEESMKNAPPEVKALHDKLKSGTAPVDSSTSAGADIGPIDSGTGVAPVGSTANTTGGVAPVTSPISPATGSPDKPASADEQETSVPDAPTDLKPETKPDKPSTGTKPAPKRTPRWISQGAGASGAGSNGTAIAMGGFGFEFATSIPEISFEISPAPVAEPMPSYAMPTPEDSAVSVMTGDEVKNRLAAIQGIRGNLPPPTYGAVSQPYGRYERDPSAEVRLDVDDRYREVETHVSIGNDYPAGQQPQEYPQQDTPVADSPAGQPSPVENGGMVQLGSGPEPVETRQPTGQVTLGSGPMPPPVEPAAQTGPLTLNIPASNAPSTGRVAVPSPQVTPRPATNPVSVGSMPDTSPRIGGTYRLQDTSSGVTSISITPGANDTLTVQGFGRPITLQRDGNSYIGEGATLFGQGNHLLRVTQVGNGLRVEAEHPSGGRFATALVR